ncbi:MAG: hypothetical protein R2778_07725 [Saprospiraceae bacterium]
MASETGVWRVVVIAIVAGGAIIRNGYVRSIEYIIVMWIGKVAGDQPGSVVWHIAQSVGI